jgi:hypothetical protein
MDSPDNILTNKGVRMGRVKIWLMVIITLLCAHGSSLSEEESVSSVAFSREDLTVSTLDGYNLISLGDCSFTGRIGEPLLPSRTVHIAIPAGARVTGVEVVAASEEVLSGTFVVYPGQLPKGVSLSRGSAYPDQGFIEPDPVIYSSSDPYPGKLIELVHQGDVAGQELACLVIYPIQYLPSEKKLFFHDRIEFKVEYAVGAKHTESAGKLSEQSQLTFEKLIEGMVLNPQDVMISSSEEGPQYLAVPPGDYDHVIITNTTLKPYFQDLVDWNTVKGVPDTVVTLDWIYANYSGSDNQARIRAFVIDANAVWGTIWFTLGGDVSVVPVKTKYFSITGEYVPGDQYYSDYDDDWYCEVFVGRASVQNASEVNTFVNKVLTYEKDPPLSGYPLEAFFFAFDLDGSTHSEVCKQDIDNLYVPARFDPIDKEYDSQAGNHRADCINALNAGHNLANHSDHSGYDVMGVGYVNHYELLYNSDMDALTNGNKQTILYSLGCDPCYIDLEDCIAEHFVHDTNGGGVAFVGNTRYGWYNYGSYNTLSMKYDRAFFKSLFTDNMYRIGATLADSKNDNPPGGDPYNQYIVWELTLLGEPGMAIWTDTPATLTVTYPTNIPIGSRDFTVTVTHEGNPLADALVCLKKTGEVYAYGLTGGDGTKTFAITTASEDTMSVTVTAQNHLPHEGTCAVGSLPDISITLTPDATTVPRGGILSYTVAGTNNTGSSQTFEYWADVTLPNSHSYSGNPVFGPVTATLGAGQTRSAHISHVVPDNAPLGMYTYDGRIGTHPDVVWNEDSFEFTVTTGVGNSGNGEDWSARSDWGK